MATTNRARAAVCLAGVLFASAPALAHDGHAHPAPAAAGAPQCFEAERSYFTNTPLVTQEGRAVRFFDDVLLGRNVLINFIFTQCKDACPLLTTKMILAAEQARSAQEGPVSLVSISVDPVNDTPEALAQFARKHGPVDDWTLLTGTSADIAQVLRRFGQNGTEPTDHTTLMLAGNVNARRWMKIPPTDGPDAVALRLKQLTSAQATGAACGG
ncbi:MAG TPA: SCO family protein [Azospirillum sp.]|nr:SCO family protein [Azospirillum sp.]